MRDRRVVVESPFANIPDPMGYLARCMADCFKRGEVPFASHGLYTLKGCLDDTIPAERTKGIQGGFLWGELADYVVVYEDYGISSGMQAGIDNYLAVGKRIVFRRIGQ